MSAVDTLADGRLALAKDNKRLALSDLDAVRARVSECSFGDDEWEDYVEARFKELDRLLREALQALS